MSLNFLSIQIFEKMKNFSFDSNGLHAVEMYAVTYPEPHSCTNTTVQAVDRLETIGNVMSVRQDGLKDH